MQYLGIALAAYLVGAVPFGYLLGRLAGKDVRAEGSRNIGATNVVRVCGWRWGALALALDACKGFAPVWGVGLGVMGGVPQAGPARAQALAAVAAVLGHTFPVYLKFRGGKGVATSAGALAALMPGALAMGLGAFVLAVAATRYVSVGSTAAVLGVLVGAHLLSPAPYGEDLPRTMLAWLLAVLVVVRHRANYARLWHGTENRLGARPQSTGRSPSDQTD